MDLSYIKPVIENGRVKVMPPSEVAAVGCEEWQNTLIGYFVGQKLNFPVVNPIAHRIWGKQKSREPYQSNSNLGNRLALLLSLMGLHPSILPSARYGKDNLESLFTCSYQPSFNTGRVRMKLEG